ncbi:hypothetical protein BDF19DRAFT_445565 [Syncephalis fuscata]|nr:hypothetical protein BDF19DRAFT_445565 [Syncephalis fuscata]
MLVTYIDKSEKMAGGPSLIIATRVFDLATGQMCMGAIKNVRGKTFLHRVTNETADIVYTTIADVPGFHIINWSIWQFSILLIEDTPRCLMEGKCTISYTMEVYSPLERLDEDRFLIRHGIRQFFNASASEQNPEVLNLAVISTRSDGLNQDINNQNFMWSHYIDIYDATPILSLDRIITSSKQGWTVYDLTNGAVLSHIDRSRLELVFSHYLTPGVGINLIGKTCWIPGFVICQGKDEYSIMLMDLLHPERSRPLKIMDTTTTLNTTPKQCTRNALFISQNDKYKIIDLSC